MYWLTNPVNTTEIIGHPDGRAWRDKDICATPPQGAVNPTDWDERSWSVSGAEPEWDLYDESSIAPLRPDEPYDALTPPPAKTFVGVVHDPAARVEVQDQYQPISLDDLLERKQTELNEYAQFVREQSARSTGNSNFWIDLSQESRDGITAVVEFYGDRFKDRVLGRDSALGYQEGVDPAPTSWWARDVPVLLIRDSNGNRLVSDVTEPEWGQLLKDKGIYDFARRDARIAVENAIDTEYTASNRAALAAIDVQSAVYGWPEYYTGPVSASIRVI